MSKKEFLVHQNFTEESLGAPSLYNLPDLLPPSTFDRQLDKVHFFPSGLNIQSKTHRVVASTRIRSVANSWQTFSASSAENSDGEEKFGP
jgi:hypothetical protein